MCVLICAMLVKLFVDLERQAGAELATDLLGVKSPVAIVWVRRAARQTHAPSFRRPRASHRGPWHT